LLKILSATAGYGVEIISNLLTTAARTMKLGGNFTITDDAGTPNTIVHIDEANKRVGIGTASPGAVLAIRTTGGTAFVHFVDSANSDKTAKLIYDNDFISIKNNADTTLITISPDGNITCSDDEDKYLIMGRSRVGYDGTNANVARFTHRDALSGGMSVDSDGNTHFPEGTWTPTLLGSTTNPTQSYTSQMGRYIRMGKLWILDFYIAMASSGISSGTGTALIGGLPFTVGSRITGRCGPISFANNWGTSITGAPIVASADPSTTTLILRSINTRPSSSAYTATTSADVTNSTTVAGTIILKED